MGNFSLSLALIAFGLLAGQALKRAVQSRTSVQESVTRAVAALQRVALLWVNPVITAGAFWGLKTGSGSTLALPVLGLFALVSGGLLGLAFSAGFRHDRKRMGSMYVSSSFTNIGNFGGLVCFFFFGEGSFVYVSMYKLLEEVYYYLLGYPLAKWFGESSSPPGDEKRNKGAVWAGLVRIVTDPYIAVYAAAIFLGLMLRFAGIPRPGLYAPLNSVLIPLSSVLLVVSVGYRMRFSAVAAYRRECIAIAAIKFVLVPALVYSALAVTGLTRTGNPEVLRVALVLAAMPPAFNSLIPPQIYGLDVDLSNSVWICATAALLAVIPALAVALKLAF